MWDKANCRQNCESGEEQYITLTGQKESPASV